MKFTILIMYLMLMLVGLIPFIPQATSPALFEVPAQLGEGKWISMGPAPINNCVWTSKTTRDICSGRVTAIAIDPNNPATIYIGGAQGGVWKSTNGGSNWIPLTDDQPSLAVGSIAIAPNGDIYVGTGEGNRSAGSYYGAGILKSTDGGKTWRQLGESTFHRSSFTKIAIDPKNQNNIIATTTNGYSISSTIDMTVNPSAKLGVYRSVDGANSWSLMVTAKTFEAATDVVFDPIDPSTVYAAVDGGVYISRNGGSSWTGPLSGGLPSGPLVGRINLGISPASHMTLYAAIHDRSTPPNWGKLFRSNDGGSSWSEVQVPPSYCGNQCDYNLYVMVDPQFSNIIYLGGLSVYRSTDSGAHWTDLGGISGLIHEDQHALSFSPTSHSIIYVGNDGGVWMSKNGDSCSPSSCWINLNADLSLTQFYFLAVHPTDRNIFAGGTQDNGIIIHKAAGSIWTQTLGADGGWVSFDRRNPSTVYAETNGAFLVRSDDGGVTWPIRPLIDLKSSAFTEGVCPVALDPTTPTTLYLADILNSRLYKSTNRGDTWSTLSDCDKNQESCIRGISTISVAPSNGQIVYVGTENGQMFISSDGGGKFSEISSGIPKNPVTKILVDQKDPAKVYVTFMGFGNGHVFLTTDQGKSWFKIGSNLPDVPTNAITQDPENGAVVVGQDGGGVYVYDGSDRWTPVGLGLPHVAVVDLSYAADRTILAATYGRGVWAHPPVTPSATQTYTSVQATQTQTPSSMSATQIGLIILSIVLILGLGLAVLRIRRKPRTLAQGATDQKAATV